MLWRRCARAAPTTPELAARRGALAACKAAQGTPAEAEPSRGSRQARAQQRGGSSPLRRRAGRASRSISTRCSISRAGEDRARRHPVRHAPAEPPAAIPASSHVCSSGERERERALQGRRQTAKAWLHPALPLALRGGGGASERARHGCKTVAATRRAGGAGKHAQEGARLCSAADSDCEHLAARAGSSPCFPRARRGRTAPRPAACGMRPLLAELRPLHAAECSSSTPRWAAGSSAGRGASSQGRDGRKKAQQAASHARQKERCARRAEPGPCRARRWLSCAGAQEESACCCCVCAAHAPPDIGSACQKRAQRHGAGAEGITAAAVGQRAMS
jgi:hypothetical protein